MPIENDNGTIIITGGAIQFARLLVLRGALKLQMLGIQTGRRPVSVIIREEFGWTDRSLAKLAERLDAKIEEEQRKGAHRT